MPIGCEFCDSPESYSVTTDGEYYCLDCSQDVYACDDCESTFYSSIGPETRGGRELCPACADRYQRCNDCGEWTFEDFLEDGLCLDCGRSDVIHSYGHKPKPVFFGTGPLYLGVELEVNSTSSTLSSDATAVSELVGNSGYLKEDSSLSCGFEIVLHPHSPAALREVLTSEFFDALPDSLSSYESGECGLHVHVSRSALTPLQLGKLSVFMHSEGNLEFLECVAQRSIDRWARQQPKTITRPCSYTRYESLNLTPKDTVEFRIFRGNLRFDRVWKNLEFVLALIEYCDVCSIRRLGYSDFLGWLQANPNRDYKHLVGFLVNRRLLKKGRVKCV